jgi:nucleoside-diphosphate-sugar epimerase
VRVDIYGTHVLLGAAKCCDTIRRFVHVSTDEVYGEGEDFETDPMTEEHILEPTNPYAATKAGAEFLAKSYRRSFKLPLIITRGNNVYGPHQVRGVLGAGERSEHVLVEELAAAAHQLLTRARGSNTLLLLLCGASEAGTFW